MISHQPVMPEQTKDNFGHTDPGRTLAVSIGERQNTKGRRFD